MKIVVEEVGSKWIGLRPIRVHSAVLAVAGLVYIAIGATYLTVESTPQRAEGLKYALNWLSYNDWGWVWLSVGVLSAVSARWPPVSETWGYMMLTGQASAWSLFYLAGVVFGGTATTNLRAALVWGLLGFMWWAISRLVNPEVMKILLDRIRTLQAENLALHDEIHRLRENRG
jgi:hypothetical protein